MAKMKMQIPVTNQKTKWMRPASRVAGSGSQCRRVATRTPSPPATAAKRASWTIEPLRTCPRIYWTGGFRGVSNPWLVGIPGSPVKEAEVGLGVGIFLIAVGAILAFAVHVTTSGVNIHTVGWILMAVGFAGILLSLIFWSSWAGPGYLSRRRTTYVDEGPPPY